MRLLFSGWRHSSRNWGVVGALVPWLAACSHTVDPTMMQLPLYDMPAAVVVQSPPVWLASQDGMRNPTSPVVGASSPSGTPETPVVRNNQVYVPPPCGTTTAPHVPCTVKTAAVTVVRMAPIVGQRPSYMIVQPPVWVGNPPVPIPTPPVILNQSSVYNDQSDIVISPPRYEFGQTAMMQPPAVPKVETTTPPPPRPADNVSEGTSKPKKGKKGKKKKKS